MNRRAFISSLAATWSFVALAKLPPGTKRKEIFLSGYELKNGKKIKETGMKIITDSSTKTYPLKNEIHSVLYSAKNDIKVFIPKIDKVSYGWVGKGSLQAFAPAPGYSFYGHGAIDEKRNLLYTTQSQSLGDGTVPGFIHVYSLPDFKLIDKFPSYGSGPHDLKIIRDELVVCNGAANPAMAHIDLETRKLIKSHPSLHKHTSLTHCAQIDEENFAVATTTRDEKMSCPLYLFNLKTGIKEFNTPDQVKESLMRVQLLSVVCFENHIYVTCPTTSMVLVWEKTGNFLSALPIPGVANLAVSKERNGVIAGSGNPGESFKKLSFSRGQILVESIDLGPDATKSGSGAHSIII